MKKELKKTPLYEAHRELGAKFVDFCGWEMPVQYKSGLIKEHETVRNGVGIFDVSHMGEIEVSGERAKSFLQYVTTNNIDNLSIGEAQYSLMLNEEGGVVDDLIIYRLKEDNYFLCVNACNVKKDFDWLASKNKNYLSNLKDLSNDYSEIAVQGKFSREVVKRILKDKDSIKKEVFRPFLIKSLEPISELGEKNLLVASTGYTGEDGLEIFCSPKNSLKVWNKLLEVGEEFGISPVGLGARDTLRLEVCYPLHGHEIRDDLNAKYSSLGWVIKKDKGDFIGKDALKRVSGNKQLSFTALEVIGRGIVREGAKVYKDKVEVGYITSGTYSPSLKKSIALSYIDSNKVRESKVFEVDVRGKMVEVKVVKKPFYRRKY